MQPTNHELKWEGGEKSRERERERGGSEMRKGGREGKWKHTTSLPNFYIVTQPVENPPVAESIDSMMPTTPDEWDQFEKALGKKFKSLEVCMTWLLMH